MATSIPPHNAAEVCDAALHIIAHPDCTTRDLLAHVPGPDFPTGGIIIEGRAAIEEAYETGRGAFRTRARWHQEDTGRGTYLVVVTEIPYGVTKGRLIEKIAELINEKKLPLVADMRDESAEDIRLVFEPKSRNVDATLLMESLFKLTELESRIPLNMNVLMKGKVPKVVGLKEVLREWLDHRREVLIRRSQHRLAAIDKRLEVLAACSSPISTSTRSSTSSARRTSRRRPSSRGSTSPRCRSRRSSTCACARLPSSRRSSCARSMRN